MRMWPSQWLQALASSLSSYRSAELWHGGDSSESFS
jgi:hypothetical protein